MQKKLESAVKSGVSLPAHSPDSTDWTPGPWKCSPDYPRDISTDLEGFDEGHEELLATAYPTTHDEAIGNEAEALANARLMAAAPELRDALESLWEAVKRYDRIGFEGSELLEVMSDARAALAKAGRAQAGPVEPKESQDLPGKAGA